MGRPKLPAAARRIKVTITLDPKALAFIDANLGFGGRFSSRSDAVEKGLALLMKSRN